MHIFVVHHTNFDYKPGHMYLSCDGVYTNWKDALKKALSLSAKVEEDIEDDEEEKESQPKDKELPTTEKELKDLLPYRACVWEFRNGSSAQWWDGDDIGSHLISISSEKVKDAYISEEEE